MNTDPSRPSLSQRLAARLTQAAVDRLKQGKAWEPQVVFTAGARHGHVRYPGTAYMRLDLWLRYAKVALRRLRADAFAFAFIAPADAPAFGELVVVSGDAQGGLAQSRYWIPENPGAPFEPVLQLPQGTPFPLHSRLLEAPSSDDLELEQGIRWFETEFLQLEAAYAD